MGLINSVQSNIRMKKIVLIVILGMSNLFHSQTSNPNLNSQLQMMRKYFLEKI